MDGMTVLHEAASGGFTEIADILLKHGANINAQDGLGRTALHTSSAYGHLRMMRLLLDAVSFK